MRTGERGEQQTSSTIWWLLSSASAMRPDETASRFKLVCSRRRRPKFSASFCERDTKLSQFMRVMQQVHLEDVGEHLEVVVVLVEEVEDETAAQHKVSAKSGEGATSNLTALP